MAIGGSPERPIAMAVHGGAGAISADQAQTALGREKLAALENALDAGRQILCAGGSALDAVEVSVGLLEAAEVFNAGRGSVLRSDGSVRMDASMMCGRTARAGAVAGVTQVEHPIQLARRLLQDGPAVMVLGEAAEALAREKGLTLKPATYFVTDLRRQQLRRLQRRGGVALDHDVADVECEEGQTVGAVALDRSGHLAAATSTGGLTNAGPGRVGDTPIIGAGTWAADQSCAVSATGDGEYFIRAGFAHQIHARCVYAGQTVASSAIAALDQVKALGGHGGCIAIDPSGNVVAPFSTLGMARAFQDGRGRRLVALV